MPSKPPSDADYPLFQIREPVVSQRNDIIGVAELNRRVRQTIEANLELLWVSGELSNVLRAASGHWYFSLKDAAAQVRCVMFRNRAAMIGFTPENGMQVELRALPSLYEPRGEFQLGVEFMRRAGLGALFEAFERLKARLMAEGLFNEARKHPLPAFPRALGVVTSLKAAALRDVLTTLRRRAPMINIFIYPTAVQVTSAASEIAAAIDSAHMRIAIAKIEALIVCRGGGSIEDLWSFNEEVVARAIVGLQDETAIPVISGVGHETDFTICDFVADRRAPTPTAAAELVSPDVAELRAQLSAMRATLTRVVRRVLDTAGQRLDRAARSLISPAERLQRERDRLALFATKTRNATLKRLEESRFQCAMLRQRVTASVVDIGQLQTDLQRLQRRFMQAQWRLIATCRSQLHGARQAMVLLDPARVLDRGYSIVEHQGLVVRDASQVVAGDRVQVRLARGKLDASVIAATSEVSGPSAN